MSLDMGPSRQTVAEVDAEIARITAAFHRVLRGQRMRAVAQLDQGKRDEEALGWHESLAVLIDNFETAIRKRMVLEVIEPAKTP